MLEGVVADGQLGSALEVEGRLVGADVDRAGRAVLAVERALRPAQHLDLLDIEEVEHRRGDTGVIDVVDVDADALLEAVVGQAEGDADAADVDRRVTRIGRIDLQRRRELLQFLDVEGPGLVDRPPVERGDGQGHILRRFLAATGGDDDDVLGNVAFAGFFDRRRFGRNRQIVGVLILREGDRGRGQGGQGQQAPDGLGMHDLSLLKCGDASGGPV